MVRALSIAIISILYTTFASAGPTIKPTSALPSTDDDPAPSVAPKPPPAPEAAPRQVYDGELICHTARVTTSDPEFYMTREEAADAINTFCSRIQSGTVFKSGGTPLQTNQNDGPYGYPMGISAVWAPYPDNADCPSLDFSSPDAVTVCKQSLLRNIIDECNLSKNNLQFWKGGGRFLKDCITWEIKRVGSSDPGQITETSGSTTENETEELKM